MTAAFAVSSRCISAHTPGKGQLVDVAMLEASLAFLSSLVADYTVGGHLQGQSGNRAQSRQPTANVFKVKGGHILLAVNNEKQFGALLTRSAAGLLDPRFARLADARRKRRRAARHHRGGVRRDDDKTWEARLSKADVPCSRVWSIAEIVAHPQLVARNVLQRWRRATAR